MCRAELPLSYGSNCRVLSSFLLHIPHLFFSCRLLAAISVHNLSDHWWWIYTNSKKQSLLTRQQTLSRSRTQTVTLLTFSFKKKTVKAPNSEPDKSNVHPHTHFSHDTALPATQCFSQQCLPCLFSDKNAVCTFMIFPFVLHVPPIFASFCSYYNRTTVYSGQGKHGCRTTGECCRCNNNDYQEELVTNAPQSAPFLASGHQSPPLIIA